MGSYVFSEDRAWIEPFWEFSDQVEGFVYFAQSVNGGPVKIGYTARTPGVRLDALQTASWERLVIRVALPGSQALEHHFHRRYRESKVRGEWYEANMAEPIVEDALEFLALQREHLAAGLAEATVRALRATAPDMADLERLWDNGAKLREIAELSGQTVSQVQMLVGRMRKLGFKLYYRSIPGPRVSVPNPKGIVERQRGTVKLYS